MMTAAKTTPPVPDTLWSRAPKSAQSYLRFYFPGPRRDFCTRLSEGLVPVPHHHPLHLAGA